VLDSRLYRAAFLPALIAVFVCAFSLTDRPAPKTTPLAADAFDTSRAFGAPRQPPRDSLRELAAAFPSRRPGSAGDGGMANRVERALRRAQFSTRRTVDSLRTVDGERYLVTVTGVRPGLSSRRIVVLANRDSLHVPGLPSSRAPRRCSSSPASSRSASCARRWCWSRRPAARAGAPARACGRSATPARRSTR
jgi:hypothetical protein